MSDLSKSRKLKMSDLSIFLSDLSKSVRFKSSELCDSQAGKSMSAFKNKKHPKKVRKNVKWPLNVFWKID